MMMVAMVEVCPESQIKTRRQMKKYFHEQRQVNICSLFLRRSDLSRSHGLMGKSSGHADV